MATLPRSERALGMIHQPRIGRSDVSSLGSLYRFHDLPADDIEFYAVHDVDPDLDFDYEGATSFLNAISIRSNRDNCTAFNESWNFLKFLIGNFQRKVVSRITIKFEFRIITDRRALLECVRTIARIMARRGGKLFSDNSQVWQYDSRVVAKYFNA